MSKYVIRVYAKKKSGLPYKVGRVIKHSVTDKPLIFRSLDSASQCAKALSRQYKDKWFGVCPSG